MRLARQAFCARPSTISTTAKKLTTSQLETLQRHTFYGKEKKSLAYVIAIMNMILHGIEAPNILHTNTLAENITDMQENDQFDMILANPPFGGKERKEVQQNFPIRTGETAFLFLQHFIKMLKPGGRAAIVIKNTFLSNTDNASVSLRKLLLESCNLYTVLDCRGNVPGRGREDGCALLREGRADPQSLVLPARSGAQPRQDQPAFRRRPRRVRRAAEDVRREPESWRVSRADLDESTFDLSVKNPNAPDAEAPRSPEKIIDEMLARDADSAQNLSRTFGDCCEDGVGSQNSRRSL